MLVVEVGIFGVKYDVNPFFGVNSVVLVRRCGKIPAFVDVEPERGNNSCVVDFVVRGEGNISKIKPKCLNSCIHFHWLQII